MAREVNVWYGKLRDGGLITVRQKLLDVTMEWTDDGGKHHKETRTVTWPDILTTDADILAKPTFLEEHFLETAVRALREKLSVNATSDVAGDK